MKRDTRQFQRTDSRLSKRRRRFKLECLEPRQLLAATPVINEFLASNSNGLLDIDGDSSDWIEVYNPTDLDFNLTDWSLTDDDGEIDKWRFPSVTIGAGEFIVVFASDKDRAVSGQQLHTNFKLSAGGEFVGLAQPDGNIVSQYAPEYPEQSSNVSYGLVDTDTLEASFFATPTPGAENTDSVSMTVERVEADQPAGFYAAPISVTLTTASESAMIRYTTDGSTPSSTNGMIYSDPVDIVGTTNIRAIAYQDGFLSAPSITRSYLYLDDIVGQSSNDPAPAGFPTTVPGGQVYDYGFDPDILAELSTDQLKQSLLTIPSWSITTDSEHLFDQTSGIYANARQDGREWERPAAVELINPNGNPEDPNDEQGFQVNAGLRIRGGRSRQASNPKHSFRLFFRTEYGDPTLNYPVHGDQGVDEFKKLDLRTLQAVSWHIDGARPATWVPDPLARTSFGELDQTTTQGSWLHLYVNGQYWGLFETQERAEANFGESYFGGQADDYDAIKPDSELGYRNDPKDGNLDAFERLWTQAVARAGDGITPAFADNVAYLRAQGKNPDGSINPDFERLLDVENLIDYMMVVTYIGSTDGPISRFTGGESNGRTNNFIAIRDRTGDAGFQFIVHDMEVAYLDADLVQQIVHPQDGQVVNRNRPFNSPNFDATPDYFNPQWLHQQLMANDEYRLKFADAVQTAFFNDGPMTIDNQIERLDDEVAQIADPLFAESARWGDAYQGGSFLPPTVNNPIRQAEWAAAVEMLRNQYFPTRQEIVFDQWRNTTLGLKDQVGGYSIIVDAPLLPGIDAPAFLIDGVPQHGGNVSDVHLITFDSDGGTIFYTTDGTDPRSFGGGVSLSSVAATSGLTLNETSIVSVRVRAADGEWSPLERARFDLPTVPATAENLKVTELHYNPADPPDGLEGDLSDNDSYEFIELRNVSDQAISLDGVRFTDGIEFDFSSENVFSLAPGQRVLAVNNLSAFQLRYGSEIHVAGAFSSGSLRNSGEEVEILAADDSVIAQFEYSDDIDWPIRADGAGSSLVVVDLDEDLSDPDSWQASVEVGGSPGAEGIAAMSSVYINEILSHTDLPAVDAIELFNPTDDSIAIGGWYLSDSSSDFRKYRIIDGTVLPPGYAIFDESHFNPTPNSPLPNHFALDGNGGEQVSLMAMIDGSDRLQFVDYVKFGPQINGESWGRYTDGADSFARMAPTLNAANSAPIVGPVIISELMYNPADPETGFDDGLYEYIEIFNPTNVSQDLAGYEISGGIDFEFAGGTMLDSNQSLVLVPFDPELQDNEAWLTSFRAVYGLDQSTMIIGGYTGSLSNGGEAIQLMGPVSLPAEPQLMLIDEVSYDDKAPWPESADGDGDSLHRRTPDVWGNAAENWIGASGTPGSVDFVGVPPKVIGSRVQEGAVQRSHVDTFELTFSKGMNFAELINDGTIVDAVTITSHGIEVQDLETTADQFRYAYDPSTDTSTLTWSIHSFGSVTSSLNDAMYFVEVDSTLVTDTSGNGLDHGGEDFGIQFHRLFGDVDGNQAVDNLDLALINDSLGSEFGSSAWNPNADLNGDMQVTQADRIMVLRNSGNSIVELPDGTIVVSTDFSIYDANDKGDVTALDALVIINYLPTAEGSEPIVNRKIARFDVSLDGRITALDALLVINHLSTSSPPTGQAVAGFMSESSGMDEELMLLLAEDLARSEFRL